MKRKLWPVMILGIFLIILPIVLAGLSDGLYSKHSFDNLTGFLVDDINHSYNFTDNSGGNIKNVKGLIGNASFSGNVISGQKLTWETNPLKLANLTQTSSITMSLWHNQSGTCNNIYNLSILFGTGTVADITQDFALMYVCGTKKYKILAGPIAWTIDASSTSNFTLNSWNHLVLIVNQTFVRLYISNNLEINISWNSGGFNFSSPAFMYDGSNNDANTRPSTNSNIDEIIVWNRSLSESEINQLYYPSIGINLIFPLNNAVISTANITFNASFSTINYNLTNATIYIWNSTGIFNNTIKSVTGIINSTTWDISRLTLGNYKWNVYACGKNTTGSLCKFADYNFTFEVGALIVAEYYNNITYETAKENFIINISMLTEANLISAFFNYDNISYIVSDIKTENNFRILTKTIDIPLNPNPYQNVVKNFSWSFIFTNSGLSQQTTVTRQQNVSYISLVNCNSTYSTPAINFTIRDENNPQPTINSTFHTAIEFWLGAGNIKKIYTWENTTELNNQFKFCIYPSHISLTANLDAEYTKTGFSPRTYYLRNATLFNMTNEIKLLMLNETQYVKFFFTVTRGMIPLPNAIIMINKYDIGLGNFEMIGIRKTDGEGKFVEYMDLDKEYKFSVIKDLRLLATLDKTSLCLVSPCIINLEISEAILGINEGFYDYYADNIAYNLTFNRTSKIITYAFLDLTGLAQYFRLQVNKVEYNQSGALICNKTSYTTAGTLTCNVTGYSGNLYSQGFVSRSPERKVTVITIILEAIAEVIGKTEGLFFTLIAIITVALVGAWNPVVGIVLSVVVLFLSATMGFLAISYTSIVAIVILGIIVIIKMGGTRV